MQYSVAYRDHLGPPGRRTRTYFVAEIVGVIVRMTDVGDRNRVSSRSTGRNTSHCMISVVLCCRSNIHHSDQWKGHLVLHGLHTSYCLPSICCIHSFRPVTVVGSLDLGCRGNRTDISSPSTNAGNVGCWKCWVAADDD